MLVLLLGIMPGIMWEIAAGNNAGNNAGHNAGNNGGLLGLIRNQKFEYGYLLGLLIVFNVWDLRCATDEAMLAAAD